MSLHDDGSAVERDHLLGAIRSVFEVLLYEDALDGEVQRITELAQRAIPNCAYASIARSGHDGAYTAVTTSAVATEIDEAQYASGAGPCIDALNEQRVVRVVTTSDAAEYAQFGAAAATRGVRSSLSVPHAVRDQAVGALNLYATLDDGFDTATEIAKHFAEQVVVAVSAAILHEQTRHLVANLEVALDTRLTIGRAEGILMATCHVSGDEAFAILRDASQRTNIKLREVANHLTTTGRLPHAPQAEQPT